MRKSNNSLKQVIVAVDDEKIVLSGLRFQLKMEFNDEFIIEICERASEAIELIDNYILNGYDVPLVITDNIMPELRGDEFLKIIYDKYPDIVLIMLTGAATLEGITNAVNNAKLFRYITKPWEPQDFILTIKSALSIYNKNKQLIKYKNELEEANKDLRSLDISKNYFLNLLAHELNTPLNSILNFSALIKDKKDLDSIIFFSEIINSSASKLKRITALSLIIAKIRIDKYEMNFNQISINEVLDSSILTCQKKIKEKNITIDKRIQPGNHFTIADNYLISLAFDSILDNSANFSTMDSVITINVNKVEDLILISIADQGKGFTSETLDNLFKIFHSDDINNHSNGIGLSLALVKLILDAHNGHIEVKNNLIGAEVIITLPWSWDIQS